MFRNYFKIAWRSFVNDKSFVLINLFGLAVSLAGVLMITAFVKHELSFDKSYSNSDRIYRVVAETMEDSNYVKTFMLPDPLAYTLKSEFPEIESVTKIAKSNRQFNINDHPVTLNYINVDSGFFHMFNFPFIEGNAYTALNNNGNIVLTKSAAKKFFPNKSAIGKELNYKTNDNLQKSYTVTGVIKDIPVNTHFTAEAIVANTKPTEPLDWRGFSSTGIKYIMLKKGTDIKALEKKIPSIFDKYHFNENTSIVFQPVTSIHLHSHIKHELFPNSDIKYVYIFSFIALLILFIACINYINLTTARSLKRVKEVGIRKVMGAAKRQLAFQFIIESIVTFLIALPFAYLFAWFLWPHFASIVDIKATDLVLVNWKFILTVFAISITAGVISGAYPAFFLSRLRPVSILKDWQKSFGVNLGIRKGLIVFQFVISIALIISTIIVYEQLHLLNNMQLGFNKDQLITLPGQHFQKKASSFKNELKTGKDIVDVSISGWNIERGYGATSSMSQPDDSSKNWNFAFVNADTDFLKTLQIKLIDGRNFSPTDFSNSAKRDSLLENSRKKQDMDAYMNIISSKPIIITKTTAQNLGLKQPIIGQAIKLGALQGTVIGEINDFIGISLLEKNPMVVIKNASEPSFGNTYIRINSKNIPQTIDFIKEKWRLFFPGKDFDFSFMDDQVASLYKEQQHMATLFTTFATLAIIISLLGLFSLVALIAQQRTKEIGIRKVLGASVVQIVNLLSGNFIKLVLIAFVIATPIVWWVMNNWLQDFQYRIKIGLRIFFITGLGSLFIVLVVVAIQGVKAAIANPVDSLRME